MKKIIVLAFLSMFIVGCRKSIFPIKEEGVMKNLTGLDGCGWVIELNSGNKSLERLEPMNLSDFDIVPTDGMKVKVKYREINSASICMVGRTVELAQIEEK